MSGSEAHAARFMTYVEALDEPFWQRKCWRSLKQHDECHCRRKSPACNLHTVACRLVDSGPACVRMGGVTWTCAQQLPPQLQLPEPDVDVLSPLAPDQPLHSDILQSTVSRPAHPQIIRILSSA